MPRYLNTGPVDHRVVHDMTSNDIIKSLEAKNGCVLFCDHLDTLGTAYLLN